MTTAQDLDPQLIQSFRDNGFVHIPGIISKDEAAHFREAALAFTQAHESRNKDDIFSQHVNVWRKDETICATDDAPQRRPGR